MGGGVGVDVAAIRISRNDGQAEIGQCHTDNNNDIY